MEGKYTHRGVDAAVARTRARARDGVGSRSRVGIGTMGGMMSRTIVVTLVLVLCGGGVARGAGTVETCKSKRAHEAFAREGSAPGRGKGMTFCDAHRAKTCCGRAQTDAVRAKVVHMQLNGFSETCRDAWAAVECSVCDGRVGTADGTPICASACDALYGACRNDFFSEDGAQRLVPCRPGDVICTKLSEWIGDVKDKGAEMCSAAGWDPVKPGERWCFDGAAVASDPWRSSDRSRSRGDSKRNDARSRPAKKTKTKAKRSSPKSNKESSARRAAILAGGGAGLVYVLINRVIPLALRRWHRKKSVNSRYAARHAAERRSRAHYL